MKHSTFDYKGETFELETQSSGQMAGFGLTYMTLEKGPFRLSVQCGGKSRMRTAQNIIDVMELMEGIRW